MLIPLVVVVKKVVLDARKPMDHGNQPWNAGHKANKNPRFYVWLGFGSENSRMFTFMPAKEPEKRDGDVSGVAKALNPCITIPDFAFQISAQKTCVKDPVKNIFSKASWDYLHWIFANAILYVIPSDCGVNT